jgi:tight adherence protein B
MTRAERSRQRAAAWAGAFVIGVTAAVGWILRRALHALTLHQPALVPAVITALPAMVLFTATGWWLEWTSEAGRWRTRTAALTEVRRLASTPRQLGWIHSLPDPLEWLAAPWFRTGVGRHMEELWAGAVSDGKPSRFLLLILVSATTGFLAGSRIAGPLFGLALAFTLPLGPIQWARSRLAARRLLYDEQLPMALDSLAAGLAAGLSFQQAIAFAASELPPPLSDVLRRVDLRLRLGHPMDESLAVLLEHDAPEMMALAVEGIQLQRQFGGDLVRMLNETAGLLRERLELRREVQAVSSQGRLSGAVVAGLVPVSAGLLLLTNPGYIDVLFDSLIGQLLLVAALLLQLAGWAILSRLVRIRY